VFEWFYVLNPYKSNFHSISTGIARRFQNALKRFSEVETLHETLAHYLPSLATFSGTGIACGANRVMLGLCDV